MAKKVVGIIRVVTITDQELMNRHGKLLESLFPDFTTVTECIPDQPNGIHNDETETMAIPKIIELGKEMAKKVQALIISCAADPAVEDLRKGLSIPVIGAGSAAAGVGMALGSRIGVLNLNEETPRVISSLLGKMLVGATSPEGVSTTLDLMTPAGKTAAVKAANRLGQIGADAIVMACTGYATISLAPVLRKESRIPIVDPIEASGLITHDVLRYRA
jgi:Asp/Glu/hydantoin racemase